MLMLNDRFQRIKLFSSLCCPVFPFFLFLESNQVIQRLGGMAEDVNVICCPLTKQIFEASPSLRDSLYISNILH